MAGRASASDGRRPCEAGNHPDYRPAIVVLAVVPCLGRRLCYACGMIRTSLLLAAAAAALAAFPASARPMTARDMHSMHRLGAPEVSSDGRYAVFTISETDWAKNKRKNTLHLLDLTRPGSAPQPI